MAADDLASSSFRDPEPFAEHGGGGALAVRVNLAEHVDVERLVRDQLLQPRVLGLEFLEALRVGGIHAAVLGETAPVAHRLGDLEMTGHVIELLAGRELLVPFGELADDLIRRVPPALPGSGAARPPALAAETVAQQLGPCEGLSSPGAVQGGRERANLRRSGPFHCNQCSVSLKVRRIRPICSRATLSLLFSV